MQRFVLPLAVLLAGLAPAHAQFSRPERAVDYRQAAFTLMNNHMGRISQTVQGKTPYDKDAVLRSAEIVEIVGRLPFEAFGPGTDLLESKAKPAIWKEEARFKQLAADMQAETVKLTAAAKSGSLDNVRNQFRATAKSCDSCHDLYREK
ncbi:MAG: cytochrome c [Burkholderiaceae bacterium]|jgi:cytochrome c556|nr:cytochrome c [Burkholderiaceae bacterium]